jgi:tetratricopeptide (TPR) repeat protein
MRSSQLKAIAVLACSFALAPLCLGANNATRDDDVSLKSLYDAHRWFELRDSVAKRTTPLFYQGAVACAFNDLQRCNEKLKSVINAGRQSDEAVEAHRLLASAYFRQGKYREALKQVDAVLALKPGDSDAQSDRPMLAALSEYPDQEMVRLVFTALQLQDAGLPISIHGVQATYWFDTGADVSVMTASDAKRFGLRVLKAPIKAGDVTGRQVDSRVAVADELSIGSIRLRHVAFLVVSDDQPPFNQLPPGSRGLIGIPVLLALQEFVWADKEFEIGSKSSNKPLTHADLCFDGHHPVAQIRFEDRSLAFTLDTGATNTDLYPPFAAAFPELMRTSAKTESYKMEGVGGDKDTDRAVFSSLHFSIGEFPVVLSPAGVLLTHTIENSKFFHGNLGIDLLQQAHKTTFDFKAMTLALQ